MTKATRIVHSIGTQPPILLYWSSRRWKLLNALLHHTPTFLKHHTGEPHTKLLKIRKLRHPHHISSPHTMTSVITVMTPAPSAQHLPAVKEPVHLSTAHMDKTLTDSRATAPRVEPYTTVL